MSDDTTTTWLKKNTEIHPLKRSLKTSMRLQVNNAEMNGSIISNLDKPAQIFIPRMMQRPSIRMMKLRTSALLPEIANSNTLSKPKVSDAINGGVKVKTKAANHAFPKKSCVPVRRNQPPNSGKKQEPKIMMRPRLLPPGSMRKNARRELIEKMVKLDEESQKESAFKTTKKKLSPHLTSDNSVLRSILKKHRASLRRTSQISEEKKPKAAKKVIFEGFQMQNSENKENEKDLLLDDETNIDFAVLEEPTVFLNFPFSNNFESTPANDKSNKGKHHFAVPPSESLKNILNILSDYQAKVKYLKSAENLLNSSLESVIQSSQKLKEEFESYKKISEEMHGELSRIDVEVKEKLRRILSAEERKSPKTSLSSVDSEIKNKIRLSDKSKNIRKNSAKKPGQVIKRFWITPEENYTLVEKENVLSNSRICQ